MSSPHAALVNASGAIRFCAGVADTSVGVRGQANQRRKDRLDDAERVLFVIENVPSGMAQAASEMIGVQNCTDS